MSSSVVSYIVSVTINVFLLIIRGTPLMLQLLIVYFGPGLFVRWLENFGYTLVFRWDRFTAAIVALSINYAAYFAEIYRGGISSIPKGQYEAAKVLGYKSNQTFFRIVLPQVVKIILPSMSNEVISLLKTTSLAQIIGVTEMFALAQKQASYNFSIIPLVLAGGYYLILVFFVSIIFNKLEKKLEYYS